MTQSHKSDFPIFKKHPNLVYLDSAASTQKPSTVIDSIRSFYENHYGTVHRGIYNLSIQSTNLYNAARKKIATYINAPSDRNIIFTRGTTDAINLAAFGYVKHNLTDGDHILITEIEHHANFVPWQQLAKQKNLDISYAPINDDGSFDLNQFKALINKKTKFIAVTHISNALGTILPIKAIIELAKENNCRILIDGAQAIAHQAVDVQDLDPDFYCFSGHKMYGPTGIGICYASDSVIDDMHPLLFGGDMIETVKKEGSTFAKPPIKFEAGTPPIAEAIGLAPAIDYIQSIGLSNIHKLEQSLTIKTLAEIKKCPFIHVIGQAKERSSTISFIMDGIHPHDIGTIVDNEGVAIRVGHHCAQPTMARFNVPATARVSFGVYNEENDIHRFIKALYVAKDMFGV